MTGPVFGEPDPGWAVPPRTGSRDGAVGVLSLLVAGLAFRLIIAYLLPGSGFGYDIQTFKFWADNLAQNGLYGFYDRSFFHDYTPGYLYVLYAVGKVGQLLGGTGDLIKIPPILADGALGWLVWSMARELGASRRAAWIGAFLVIVNPVSWFDSALWGQVDSVGTLVLLLALRELWRDRPERSAFLAVLAALIKPQLGILIPIVAIVVIRRALRPEGGFGEEPAPVGGATAWERNVRGPIRIFTTGLVGLVTAFLISLPFGLSLPGLVQQVFSTAGGYPYLSVNAFNPWALVSQDGSSLAGTRTWVCDSTVLPSGPITIRIGDLVLWSSPGSTLSCPNGVTFGVFPAVLVGAVLFLVAAAVVVILVARRPDRKTMLVGLAILALAFYVLPTRVHERYLYPAIGIWAILAAFSLRWRVAYILSSLGLFANIYAVLTSMGYEAPGLHDWLGIGPFLTSWPGIALAAISQVVVLAWAFAQLRDDRLDELADEIGADAVAEEARSRAGSRAGLPRPIAMPRRATGTMLAGGAMTDAGAAGLAGALPPPAPWSGGGGTMALATGSISAASASSVVGSGPAGASGAGGGAGLTLPAWDDRYGASLGLWSWFKERFNARPIRPDRSRALEGEGGGRFDRLDVWMLAVLVVTLLTVRVWRLSEPYGMHFDEVYHARTATEFLQDWRYGISHDIYEWTHPHLAKYSIALGIEAWGNNRTDATSDLGVPVTDAALEPRWDQAQNNYAVAGDRLWVATGTQVRAYDLSTRALVATLDLPGATALAVDQQDHRVFVGFSSGDIETIDTQPLDDARAAGTTVQPQAQPFMAIESPIQHLLVTDDDSTIAAVLAGTGTATPVAIIDANAARELKRTTLDGVTQLADVGNAEIGVADKAGLTLIDEATGDVKTTMTLEGPAMGLSPTQDLTDNPVYVSVQGPTGPVVDVVTTPSDSTAPRLKSASFQLPGESAGWVFYDDASRMVHVIGTQPGDPSAATVYVIDPAGNSNAVYADAPLASTPAAMVMDSNERYPETDRQQLLSLSATGQVGSIEVGDNAFAWRLPGVLAGVLMAVLMYVLARMLFKRRWIAVAVAFLVAADGMLFTQSRIAMNDSYVGLGIVAAYTLFAAIWLRPGGSKRHWIAFWLAIPVVGVLLGLALASKWVAAYAIGGLGLLVLSRSAFGRLLLILGMIGLTTVLGYLAISVPSDEPTAIPNYLFLLIMVGLTLIAVVANILHPIAWTKEEDRLAVGTPIVVGALILVYGLIKGGPFAPLKVGLFIAAAPVWALLALLGAGLVYIGFELVGTLGFGPRALPVTAGSEAILEPPAPAPAGWLRLGSGYGLPIIWMILGLLVIPLVVYVISYIPWAMVENHRLWAPFTFLGINIPQWPPDHTGTGLGLLFSVGQDNLTAEMYRYHNDLNAAHPASSPWWAWPFDFKPVWFYEGSFAGGTSASIYDAGNLVSWWLAIPAMGFAAFQAFKRRSPALALLAIGFACQWISWARIDRAAFQYHYYTSLPFLLIALAYFLAELWNGASKHTWLLARIAGGVAVLAPFGLWLFHRPLCALVRVQDINPGSQACPTLIPDLTITPRALAIAAVVGIGVLLLFRFLVSTGDDGERPGGEGLGKRLRNAGLVAFGLVAAYLLATTIFTDQIGGAAIPAVVDLQGIPVEPIALLATLALTPIAAFIVTARDARRFVAGVFGAIGFWFVLWYPNISALPLPSAIHNAYQGLLPTYVYPFQFWVDTLPRTGAGPSFSSPWVPGLFGVLVLVAIVVGYSAWTWRFALAERRREEAEWNAAEGSPP